MDLPFTKEQFFDVFRKYNSAIYPIQILLLGIAVLVIFLIVTGSKKSQRLILPLTGCLWIWMGTVYHVIFFSAINKAAYLFGAVFIIQGLLLIFYGFASTPRFFLNGGMRYAISSSLVLYALLVYPLIGFLSGHTYLSSPTFGLPCPTTIFTLAILLMSERRLPFYLSLIPLIWSVIGFSAAFSLGVYQDIALLLSGLAFAILYVDKKSPSAAK